VNCSVPVSQQFHILRVEYDQNAPSLIKHHKIKKLEDKKDSGPYTLNPILFFCIGDIKFSLRKKMTF
jgi:hypothetical protein